MFYTGYVDSMKCILFNQWWNIGLNWFQKHTNSQKIGVEQNCYHRTLMFFRVPSARKKELKLFNTSENATWDCGATLDVPSIYMYIYNCFFVTFYRIFTSIGTILDSNESIRLSSHMSRLFWIAYYRLLHSGLTRHTGLIHEHL